MTNYRFMIGSITILSGLIALSCLIVGAMAVEFNFDAFADPMKALNYADNASMARAFMILDMIGYYLLLLPVAFFLNQQYKFRSPWTPLYTFTGVAYVLVGSIGAAILAAVWPELMNEHVRADSMTKELIALQFQVSTIAVTKGLWNILEVLFASVWWIGMGSLLYQDNKAVGILSIVTGVSALTDGMANIVGLQGAAELSLNVYLVLGIVWPVAIGIFILKKQHHETKHDQRKTFSP